MNNTTFNIDDIEPKYPDDYYISCHEDGSTTAVILSESVDKKYNPMLRKFIYSERIKLDKDILLKYKDIKTAHPMIKFAYIRPELYKNDNLFVDLTYYHEIFIRNNIYKGDKAIKLYFDFLCRILDRKDLKDLGYSKFTIFVPVDISTWGVQIGTDIFDYKSNINIFSMIDRMIRINPIALCGEFSKYSFIFINSKGYFTIDFENFELKNISRFKSNISTLLDTTAVIVDDDKTDSAAAITNTIVDKIETNTGIKIDNVTGKSAEKVNDKPVIPNATPVPTAADSTSVPITKTNKEDIETKKNIAVKKDYLVSNISYVASNNTSIDDTIKSLDSDVNKEYIKSILSDLAADDDNGIKISTARASRISNVKHDFLSSSRNGSTIGEIIGAKEDKPLPSTAIKIDSINDEWKDLKFINFNKEYNLDNDIMRIINCFSDKTVKVAVISVESTDSSTSEDYIDTYIVNMEDENGKRFTLKFDVPKLINHRFMRLRGNEKTISGQLVLLPIIKTAKDTVQIVSNYNKIFVRTYGTSDGKSFVSADRIIKTFNKADNKINGIKLTLGNNEKTCAKYELPIDYIDLSRLYTKIETKNFIVYFNQDEIRNTYKIDSNKGIPCIYNKKTEEVVYYDSYNDMPISYLIAGFLSGITDFKKIYDTTKMGTKYTYSKASILNNQIPIIVILGYNIGLIPALDKAGVKYELHEKLDDNIKGIDSDDYIKFNDGYLIYKTDAQTSLLMNGIKECDTANYSLKDLNSKAMWLDFLDEFGGRILADGLDNFYDLMVDPITVEVCDKYKLPKDYCEQLIYANNLLVDNKFNRHVDITGNRYRSNEIIAGYVYKVLSKAYGEYRTKQKRTKQEATMSVKQSAVIDAILLDPTASDLSILNPLLEVESANNVTFKGLAGMNSDRSYGLDKRTYDDSMINLLALSTGFAANVGINRSATIDMNIDSTRGYIKQTTDLNDMSITKSFNMTEAMNPFGTTRDDPFRSAMTYIQTAKHSMRTKNSSPQLITNGADEALPYMTSDTFAFKAKHRGKVSELNNEYMIIKYDDNTSDYIDLRERVKKNSDGGFYITIQLVPDTKLKVGSNVTENQILAYDPKSFSSKIGPTDNIAYNIGTLTKVAIMNTDEGYEDSTIVSDWISDAMSSEVVVLKDYVLPKKTNLYYIVEPGQHVQEGDPLLIFQNAFDEDDVNILLKNITDDEDFISDLGRIPIKSKVTGVVQDINIYRTVEKDELSDSLRKLVDTYEKGIVKKKEELKKLGINDTSMLEPTQSLEATGKLKNAKDSIYIEIYLKYDDKLSIGDKIVATSAAKGVVKDIFPVDKEPTSEFRPDEKIHAMFANGSFNARMIGSVLNQGVINKGLIELDRAVKDIMGVPYTYLDGTKPKSK